MRRLPIGYRDYLFIEIKMQYVKQDLFDYINIWKKTMLYFSSALD